MTNLTPPERFSGHDYPQIIPVPPQRVAGQPAPWFVDTARRSGISLETVAEALRRRGQHLDNTLIPSDVAELSGVADGDLTAITRQSAVLVALFEEDGETHVVLTRRSMQLRHHRGEVALPGGRSDGEESAIETALREAHEEVGIAPSTVTPIAWLTPLVTFASGSAIWPVVGILGARPTLVSDPVEVERAFTVSLTELLADDAFLEERWRRETSRPGSDPEGFFPISFFRVPGEIIWGATGRILRELLTIVSLG